MKRCKHKHWEERNILKEDYYTVEYDVYCEDCGKYLGHWNYGCSDVEENIKFEKWYNRAIHIIKTYIKNKILDFKIWGFKKHNDTDLPF